MTLILTLTLTLGGASRVTGNTIRDGSGGSLCLSQHSRGLIASNVIHQQPDATMQVPERMLAEVQSHNDIRYDDDIGHTELLSSTYFETGRLSLSDME